MSSSLFCSVQTSSFCSTQIFTCLKLRLGICLRKKDSPWNFPFYNYPASFYGYFRHAPPHDQFCSLGPWNAVRKKSPWLKAILLHSLGANAKLLNLSHLICWHLSGLRLNPPRGVSRSALLLQSCPIPSNRQFIHVSFFPVIFCHSARLKWPGVP